MESPKIGDIYTRETTKKYNETTANKGGVERGGGESDVFLLSQIPKNLDGKAVLDLGSGDGHYSKILHDRGAEIVIALDLSSPMLGEVAAKKNEHKLDRLSLLKASIDHIPIRADVVDYIFSRFSVMYAADLPHLMRSLSTLLKDTGEILIQANVAILHDPTGAHEIQDTPIPLQLNLGEHSVEIQNYARTKEDYHHAFTSANLDIVEEQYFPAHGLSVNPKHPRASTLDFQYVIFRLTKRAQ